jgi:PAS domain S-box-containing protein
MATTSASARHDQSTPPVFAIAGPERRELPTEEVDAKVDILVVDDNAKNILAFEAMLESLGQNVVHASSGTEALERLLERDFALTLLDIQMPGLDGFQTAQLIRARERSKHMPIIFLTAYSKDDAQISQGYELGAVDFLFKPVMPFILRAKVQAFVDLYQKTREIKRQAVLLCEIEHREDSRRLRELADAMPQVVWGARPDGHFDYYNRRWYELTGLPEGLRAGAYQTGDAAWAEVVHADDFDASMERWRAALLTGETYEIEHRLKRKEGDYVWHLTRALPVRNANGEITRWFGTSTDIDQRKRTEDRLRSTTVLLTQNNRELEEFASVASHDLQEPLRKIHSFASCLRDEEAGSLSVDGRDYLDRIQNAALRMTTLVADLLELSRLTSKGKPFVPVDLNVVAAEVLSDLESRVTDSGGRVEILELPTVSSDPVQMRQLLQNLIGNALKFHRPGETPVVRVSAEVHRVVDTNGRVQPGGTCLLSVADNGIGFDEKYLDRVFTIFQRLHGRGEYEGTGIGLAICRKIAERHGGTITARSAPGRGSTFLVSLPLLRTVE